MAQVIRNPDRLTDGMFKRRRMINGIRVLVRSFDEDGLLKGTFILRIKYPDRDVTKIHECHYYWQVFNHARNIINEQINESE